MPPSEFIPYGRQSIGDDDIAAVVEVLRSEFLTQGPTVPRFEAAVASSTDAKFGVAVNSATSALHLACLALGLGPGDSLWTSPNTFVASSNCGLYCGAEVDFVDIDPRTYNMSVMALEEKLIQAEQLGRLPKIVIPVHFAGQSCDMRGIRTLANRYGFRIIEDASHAIGGRYLGEPIGNCQYSDITVFSFHPVKLITTGEGGLLTTNDANIATILRRLRSHGITREPGEIVEKMEGGWSYQQIELGYNYRMTDMQAALGLSQLNRLDEFVLHRHARAERYDEWLAALPIQLPYQGADSYSALHLYPIVLKDTTRRRDVFDQMRKAGILVNVHYIPVYTQPYYRKLGFQAGLCPESERYYAGAITLPLYPALTGEQQRYVVEILKQALQ